MIRLKTTIVGDVLATLHVITNLRRYRNLPCIPIRRQQPRPPVPPQVPLCALQSDYEYRPLKPVGTLYEAVTGSHFVNLVIWEDPSF
jgi:hypothetical protein